MDWYRLLPKYWMQNYKTDLEWDKELNDLLDSGIITFEGFYVALVNGVKVWTGNWPYAYGHLWEPNLRLLPKIKTRKRLKEAITKAAINQARSKRVLKK